MGNYITAQEFTDITGITAQEVEATGSETLFRDLAISGAQLEFARDVQRNFDTSEQDYILVQRAVAFLTAHRLRLKKMELIPTENVEAQTSSPYLKEYKRLKTLVMQSKAEDTKPIFGGGFSVLDSEDMDSDFKRDSFIDKR